MPPKKKPVSALNAWLDKLKDPSKFATSNDLSPPDLEEAYGLRPGRNCAPSKFTTIADETESDFSDSVFTPKKKGKAKEKQTTLSFGQKPTTQCSHEKCADNPKCLTHMGQKQWENSAKAFKLYAKAVGLPDDPSERERDHSKPVGLRNLGATCYANSFLQVWFQHLQFRAGVYKCLVPSSIKQEESPLLQLQTTFAALQNGVTSVFNPKPLIASLKLQEGEQQDSTEFGKLFLSLLQNEFKKQQDSSVKTLVSDLFEGKIVYGTECSRCKNKSERPSGFLELEINLKPGAQLEEQIDKMLASERLTGDNKYRCEPCDKLVDAKRYVALQSLPAVLHFSLLRFVFDEKTFDRKKSTSYIKFPRVLNMAEFCPTPPGSSAEDMLYDVKGVLLHKGTSAHHGHYVAWVFDVQQQEWFCCDDESVDSIKGLNKRPGEKLKEPPRKKRKTDDGSDDVVAISSDDEIDEKDLRDDAIKSKDAYMLIYTRRSATADPKTFTCTPGPVAQQKVQELSDEYSKDIEEYTRRVDQVKADFESARDARMKLFSKWKSSSETGSQYVDVNSLKDWVSGPLKKAEKPKKKDSGVGTDDLPDPDEVSSLAVATASTSAQPMDADPPATNDHAASMAQDKPPEGNGKDSAMKIDNSAIACPHGLLLPSKVGQSKQISEAAVHHFENLNIEISPYIPADNALCGTCVWDSVSSKSYSTKHKEHTLAFSKVLKPQVKSEKRYWISSAWMADWLKVKPKMHLEYSGSDPAPDADAWKGDVECSHGSLAADVSKRKMIPEKAYEYLRGIFPQWNTFSEKTRRCSICTGGQEIDVEKAAKQVSSEKADLRMLVRPGRDEILVRDETYFAVPKVWFDQWREWLADCAENDRPTKIEFPGAFCENHDGVLFDISEREERRKWNLVTPQEWEKLRTAYPADEEVQVNVSASLTPFTDKPICRDCMYEKKRDFDTADARLRILTKADFDSHGQKIPCPDDAASEPIDEVIDCTGVDRRRSERNRKGLSSTGKKRVYKESTISINKWDTVKDLKVAIALSEKIPALYAKLFFNEQELESDQTMASINILPGDRLEVYRLPIDDQNLDLTKLDDSIDKNTKSRGRKAKIATREEGFQKTGLTGWDTPGSETEGHVTEPSEDVEMAPLTRACPQCTFENDLAKTLCEICEGELIVK